MGLAAEAAGAAGLVSSRVPSLKSFKATDESWKDDAACRNAGVDFFPSVTVPYRGYKATPSMREEYEAKLAEALALCERCPVRLECARAGQREQHGIWGGVLRDKPKKMSAEQRRRVRERERASG